MADAGPMRTAPTELDYNPYKTPLAISSESKRVSFLPTNNGDFEYGKTQVISIDINSDSYLDVSQSYLKATIENLGDGPLCLDTGACFIKRLVIKNAGTVLEDIHEYHRLYGIFMETQTNDFNSTQSVYTNEEGCYHAKMRAISNAGLNEDLGGNNGTNSSLVRGEMRNNQQRWDSVNGSFHTSYGLPAWSGSVTTTPQYPCPTAKFIKTSKAAAAKQLPGDGSPDDGAVSVGPHLSWYCSERGAPGGILAGKKSVLRAGEQGYEPGVNGATWGGSLSKIRGQTVDNLKGNDRYTMCIPLVSCLFNSETFIPLLLTTAGITLEIHLCSPDEVGVAYKADIKVAQTTDLQEEDKSTLQPGGDAHNAKMAELVGAQMLAGSQEVAKTTALTTFLQSNTEPVVSAPEHASYMIQKNKLVREASDATDAKHAADAAVAAQQDTNLDRDDPHAVAALGSVQTIGKIVTPSGQADTYVKQSPYDVAKYKVTNVEYVGHTIILPNDFDANLRAQVAASGSLSTHGTCYKHFSSTFAGTDPNVSINIPARMKSIKSILCTFRDQSTGTADLQGNVDGDLKPLKITGETGEGQQKTTRTSAQVVGLDLPGSRCNPFSSVHGCFPASTKSQMGIKSYGLRVGSAQFPERDISLDNTGYCGNYDNDPCQKPGYGCAEAFCETLRAFGKLGLTDKTTTLNRTNYSQTGNTVNSGPGDLRKSFIMGFDVKSFGKSVIESGVDTASRALPIQLHFERDVAVGEETGDLSELEKHIGTNVKIGGKGAFLRTDKLLERYNDTLCHVRAPAPKYVQCDSYVMSDCWMFFNADGTITPSV